MKAQRAWRYGLTALFVLGALQSVHMLVDLDATLQLRIELYGEEVDAVAGGFWSILPMVLAGAITVPLGLLLVWRGLHLPAARALIAFLLCWHPPLGWLWLAGIVEAERVAHLAGIIEVGSMIPLLLFAIWFPRRLEEGDLAAARPVKPRGRLRTLLGRPWRWLRKGFLRPRFFAIGAALALVLAILDHPLALVAVVVAIALTVSYLRAGYLVADEDGRKRSIWILNGFSVGLWVLIVGMAVVFPLSLAFGVAEGLQGGEGALPTWLIPALEIIYAAAWLAILGSLVAATLYRGALDPSLVLRKTTVYGALGVLAAFLFAALENVVSAHVAVWLGFPGSSGGWIAGGLVALTVGPLRSRLERRTDRVIDRLLPPTELARGERRRSVVVFSDLSGYTRLSAEDPDAALTAASLLHKVAQRTANRFRGRVVKTLGDGVLMEFGTTESAVRATDFAAESFATAAEVLGLPPLKVTSGVHAGEVVDGRDGDIFGEAVNIAAKIEAAAAAGEVWVSRAVADQLAVDPATRELVGVGSLELPGLPVVECFRVVPPADYNL